MVYCSGGGDLYHRLALVIRIDIALVAMLPVEYRRAGFPRPRVLVGEEWVGHGVVTGQTCQYPWQSTGKIFWFGRVLGGYWLL